MRQKYPIVFTVIEIDFNLDLIVRINRLLPTLIDWIRSVASICSILKGLTKADKSGNWLIKILVSYSNAKVTGA